MKPLLAALVAALALAPPAYASKCDTGIDKAVAKKFSCICKAITKGATLAAAEAACSPKFATSCAKAKVAADCVVQTGTCADIETEVDDSANTLCNGATTTTTTTTTTTNTTTTTTTLRFMDNGDGTVTDHQTGLVWEKKVNPGGGATDPHAVGNHYTWGNLAGCPFTGCPNGAAFTDFLGRLNNCTSNDGTAVTSAGFAGHCDWRLPTIQELNTIVEPSAPGCGSGSPCIDPIFGPTNAAAYWSSTTVDGLPGDAWLEAFINIGGFVNFDVKANTIYVRAVRSGS